MTEHALRLGSGTLTYRFERARRRTIGLVIDRHGLRARAPRWVPLAEVESFIREKEQWIRRKLAEIPERGPQTVDWRFGQSLELLGRALALVPAAVAAPRMAPEGLLVPATLAEPAALRAAVVKWMRAIALVYLCDRVRSFAPLIGKPAPHVSLSNARTQWGSCSVRADGHARIRLHWRLVQLPERLVDYVVAHELAHLHEMNHSPRFWGWVGRMIPDHLTARRELRALTHLLPEL